MKVIFYLKGGLQLIWEPVDDKLFNFFMLVKAVRSDGHFLAERVYIQTSEIAAIRLDTGREEPESVEVTRRKENVVRVN